MKKTKNKRFAGRKMSAKDALIASDIREKILNGVYEAGGTLPAYPFLLREYGVGQSVIVRALGILESEGIIKRERRSGCHISENAILIIREIKKNESSFEFESGGGGRKISVFEITALNLIKKITIFTPDSNPVIAGIWKDVLREFCSTRQDIKIKLQIAYGGIFDPSHDFSSIDIVHGTQNLFRHIGEEDFLRLEDLSLLGFGKKDLVAPFSNYIESVKHPRSIPFFIIPNAFFINRDIERKYRLPRLEECGSMQEIISMLRRIIESGVLPRDIGYGLGALGMMLTCDGMVRLDSLGGWKIDVGGTRKLIELLHSLYRLRKPENIFTSGSNVEAKTWVQNIFTFHNEILNMKKSLKYGILPIPLAKDAVVCVQPTFLGIKAKQRNLPECLTLAEYLCSEKIQRRFCAAGAGIFSRAKLLNETDTMAPLKIPCAELKKLMSNSSIMFSEKDSGMMESLYRIGLDMIEDLIPSDEVMRRIELLRMK